MNGASRTLSSTKVFVSQARRTVTARITGPDSRPGALPRQSVYRLMSG